MIDVEAIRARRAAITPGQWKIVRKGNALSIITKFGDNFWQWRGICHMLHKDGADARFILTAPDDIDDLLAEVDRLNEEVARMQVRETARKMAREHIDTEPRRRKTVDKLPFVGITTTRGVLRDGGCIAVDLKGTEALITVKNVAVGRLRPGTRAELDESEIPVKARVGSYVTYSLHPVALDPHYCTI